MYLLQAFVIGLAACTGNHIEVLAVWYDNDRYRKAYYRKRRGKESKEESEEVTEEEGTEEE